MCISGNQNYADSLCQQGPKLVATSMSVACRFENHGFYHRGRFNKSSLNWIPGMALGNKVGCHDIDFINLRVPFHLCKYGASNIYTIRLSGKKKCFNKDVLHK